jgi:hypothetical protein
LEGWEFRCKLYGTKTLNTRGLEPRKLEDEEGMVVTDRQRNTMVKAKKDCGFNYLLSHKAVSKGSEEKKYIKTFKCLIHTPELGMVISQKIFYNLLRRQPSYSSNPSRLMPLGWPQLKAVTEIG